MSDNKDIPVKNVTLVGDHVGKTSLLIAYFHNEYPDYIPTQYGGINTKEIDVDGNNFAVIFFDCGGGGEDFWRMRPLYYPRTDAFMLCFSIDSPDSLKHVSEMWIPEVRKVCPDVPIILVGTKTDLRNDEATIEKLREANQEPVQKKDGEDMASKINAVTYLECSSKLLEGVNEVFDTTMHAAAKYERTEKKKFGCCLT